MTNSEENDMEVCPNCGAVGYWPVEGVAGRQTNGLDADVFIYHCEQCDHDWSD